MMSLDCVNKMADYLKYFGHFVLKISLDLMKSSEVRKAGDRYKCLYCDEKVFFFGFLSGI